jgi:hypothetical protein
MPSIIDPRMRTQPSVSPQEKAPATWGHAFKRPSNVTMSGAVFGGTTGAFIGGPAGAALGLVIGGAAGEVIERYFPSKNAGARL